MPETLDGGSAQKAQSKTEAVAGEKAGTGSTGPEMNKGVDQERFTAFTAYIREQIPKMLDKLQPMYKITYVSMLGEDAATTHISMPRIVVSQFERFDRRGDLAASEFSSNTITVYRPMFERFSAMLDSKGEGARERLRAEMETALGHELGHLFIDNLTLYARTSDKYSDESKQTVSFFYVDSGERMQEALAHMIGTYVHLSLRGSETDCASIAEQVLGEAVRDLYGAAAYNELLIDRYDAAIRDMGVDALRARGAEEPTEEEIRLAGLGRFNEVCESNTRWCIVYVLPRVGLATAMAGRGSGSLARFISDALERPESLGQAVSDMVLDGDYHIEKLRADLDAASLAGKNEILRTRFLDASSSAVKVLQELKRAREVQS